MNFVFFLADYISTGIFLNNINFLQVLLKYKRVLLNHYFSVYSLLKQEIRGRWKITYFPRKFSSDNRKPTFMRLCHKGMVEINHRLWLDLLVTEIGEKFIY